MSKPIDYSKFDNIHDSDSDSDGDGDGDGEESESIQNEATTNTPTSTTTVTPAVTVTAPTPMMATRQDSETGRYIFECNGHKVYEWDQNLEEVNLYIAAPRQEQKRRNFNSIFKPRGCRLESVIVTGSLWMRLLFPRLILWNRRGI